MLGPNRGARITHGRQNTPVRVDPGDRRCSDRVTRDCCELVRQLEGANGSVFKQKGCPVRSTAFFPFRNGTCRGHKPFRRGHGNWSVPLMRFPLLSADPAERPSGLYLWRRLDVEVADRHGGGAGKRQVLGWSGRHRPLHDTSVHRRRAGAALVVVRRRRGPLGRRSDQHPVLLFCGPERAVVHRSRTNHLNQLGSAER